MPTIKVPLASWTSVPALKKSKKFKRLADEGVVLTLVGKLVKARRSEISLEMYDTLDGTLPETTKSLGYGIVEGVMSKDDIIAQVSDFLDALLPDEVDFEEGVMLTRKSGGPSYSFSQKLLMQTPIPCSNPKCKTDNHVTTDIIESCKVRGEDRRPSVSIKLPGEKDDE